MPTPPEGIDSASQLQNGSEFGCLIYFRTLPRWTLFFPNQLTQLDNPAFSRLTYVFSLLSFPFSVLFFFCSFLMPRRSIRLPTCLQERLVPLLRLVFLAPPYLSSFPKPFPSTVFFPLFSFLLVFGAVWDPLFPTISILSEAIWLFIFGFFSFGDSHGRRGWVSVVLMLFIILGLSPYAE